jgi:membrane dipeptidase
MAVKLLLLDTHIDTPTRLVDDWEDVSSRASRGEFDFERARAGGLDGAFMSIYIPAKFDTAAAREHADKLIEIVESLASKSPERFALVRTPGDLAEAKSEGKVGLAMGMENGSPVGEDLAQLKHYYDRGIRYITLAHALSNQLSDSSYDAHRQWKGLSPFGREVVLEMNRLGIMVDVSHISDQAFDQVLELSRAPVIASHSSCRSFTPGFERNLSDDMIRRLAEGGGVVQINFGSSFLVGAYRQASEQAFKKFEEFLTSRHLAPGSEEAQEYRRQLKAAGSWPSVTVSDVADHIDHVVSLVGIDYVGLGSDFDGVDGELPEGLSDVSQYPNLVRELLSRGYREEEIAKICSGNLLRVWRSVEAVAASSRGPAAKENSRD